MQSHHLDPTRWLEEHGDILYHYALGRVRNPDVAEDLLQDTLLAAFKGAASFSGQSTERTWLVGILKHKILDYFRTYKREVAYEAPQDQVTDPGSYLDRKGH